MGAMVIAVGLYMVLWGKSKDGQSPQPDGDKAVTAAEDSRLETPVSAPGNVEIAPYVAVDLTKVRPTDEAA